MTPEQFVKCCATEKRLLLQLYLDPSSKAEAASLIAKMNLSSEQQAQLSVVLHSVLSDAFYTLLLALDGCASLGGTQRQFALFDEDGTRLSGSLEEYAFEHFHKEERS